MLKLLLSRLRLFLLKIKTTFVGIFKTPNPVREYKENSQRKKIMNSFGKVVVITLTISFLILFIFPFKTGASERSMTRSTTAEFNQGTTTNISTASDEMKISTRSASWYDANWPYRQKITIDHTKVGTGGVTNFPFLLTGANMPAELWANAKADGSDLRVTASDGTTEINFELVSFTPGSTAMEVWVLADAISSDSDWTGYLYWGNASATAKPAAWGQGVWSNGYAGVWHFPNGSSLSANDSTINGNNATIVTATATAGKFDGGAHFVNNYIVTPTNSFSIANNPRAITTWIKDGGTGSTWGGIVHYGQGDCTGKMFGLGKQTTLEVWGGCNDVNTGLSIPQSQWAFVGVSYNGTSGTGYINTNTNNFTPVAYGTLASNLFIGAETTNNGSSYRSYYLGDMDELHISNVFRSSSWITTEYNSQSSPATFYTMEVVEADTVPPTNPTDFDGYDTSGKVTGITSGGYYTYPTPYFEWPAAEAEGGAHDGGIVPSGVAGYYSYFGTSCGAGGANPQITRGNLSDTGGGVHYSADTNITVTDLGDTSGTYCFRIRTIDNKGNISDTDEVFTYNYDVTVPNPPAYIAANPAGYTATNLFSFSWPVATDPGSGASGIAGYQYKTGEGGAVWSATQPSTSVSDVLAYQDGVNIFYVRSIDNVGNESAPVQTAYYWSADAPAKPTGLTAIPDLSDQNSFAFDWTAPVHAHEIVDYGFSINEAPTNDNLIWTGSADTNLPADAYATLQGANTLYLVAKDVAGKYALDAANVAQVNFVCQTQAPPIPLFTAITDSSSRPNNLYALTLNWNAGSGQDPNTFDHYTIERSEDNLNFSQIATSTSTFYIDSGLTADTIYYYRLKAVDNADSTSAVSTVLSRKATGKYTSPPTLLREPTVISVKATEATINWVTDRASTSLVRFGTSETEMGESKGQLEAVTDHTVTITSLKPSTRYFFQSQSLDELRDYSAEAAYSATYNLTTLPAPSISNVKISNITLNSADITYDTTNAATNKIKFGQTLDYDSEYEDPTGSYTTKHTISLTDLDDSSTYHFKLFGIDVDGNSLISDDYVFDTLPRPIISNLGYQADIAGPNFVMEVNWQTNVPTSSSAIVKVGGQDREISSSEMTTNHEVRISGLENDEIYQFYVFGSDQFGNVAQSEISQMQTPMDTRPPKISKMIIETSNVGLNREDKAQIAVSWETDEPATSFVEYAEGLNGNQYTNKTVEDKALTTKHLVVISELIPSKPYHLRVVSADKANNIGRSEDSTAITGEVPKSVLQLILKTLGNTFGWLSKIFNSRF